MTEKSISNTVLNVQQKISFQINGKSKNHKMCDSSLLLSYHVKKAAEGTDLTSNANEYFIKYLVREIC
jgi:hypothetical protein